MDIDKYDEGVPCWVDLSAPDIAKATLFYADLFGWDVQTGPPEAGGYAIAHLRGRPVAGIGPQMNPGPPVWSTYVNVADADAVIAKVPGAGGQVFMPPFDVMDVGRMAVLADPAGAVISVWQPKAHIGSAIVNEVSTWGWSELMTTDVEGAKAFYAKVFGWGEVTHGEGAGAYTEWQLGGRSIGGLMAKPPMVPAEVPPNWGVYFQVADADAAAKRIGELGGAVMMGPTDIEPGRFAVATDPVGAAFNVIQMHEGAAM